MVMTIIHLYGKVARVWEWVKNRIILLEMDEGVLRIGGTSTSEEGFRKGRSV